MSKRKSRNVSSHCVSLRPVASSLVVKVSRDFVNHRFVSVRHLKKFKKLK